MRGQGFAGQPPDTFPDEGAKVSARHHCYRTLLQVDPEETLKDQNQRLQDLQWCFCIHCD